MPAANNFEDLGQTEDNFNSYLDALARGESRAADDVDPTLAETALHVHAMAARTKAEIEMMRNVWSTVQAGTGGEAAARLPGIGIPGTLRVVSWSKKRWRQRSWRFANHAAMAALLIVALVTGYFGLRGGVPNGGGNTPMGGAFADPASTPYALTDAECTTDPTTAEEIERTVMTPVEGEASGDVTVLPETPDAATIEGVQHTQQQLNACAMEPLRQYALYSDNCLRAQVWVKDPDDPKTELKPGMVASAIAAEAAMLEGKMATVEALASTPESETVDVGAATPDAANVNSAVVVAHIGAYEVIYADDIELLSDGRTGAIVRWIATGDITGLIPQNPSYRFFINVDGQWLFDCDAPVSRG